MLVGIYSSVPQSGKSTVSECFVEKGFQRVSLADPVKESLAVVLRSLNVAEYERYLWGDWKSKVIPELMVTGGYLMSTYATDFFRDRINKDVWLNCLRNKIVPSTGLYILDDLRFPNEFVACDYTVKVYNSGSTKDHGRSSKSEGQLDSYLFNYLIVNDSNLVDLKIRSNEVINNLLILDSVLQEF